MTDSPKTTAQQVIEMRQRLEEMTELVHCNMEKVQKRQKQLYDRGTRTRVLNVGEQVLVLLPNPHD